MVALYFGNYSNSGQESELRLSLATKTAKHHQDCDLIVINLVLCFLKKDQGMGICNNKLTDYLIIC